jgi:hypothetical protein
LFMKTKTFEQTSQEAVLTKLMRKFRFILTSFANEKYDRWAILTHTIRFNTCHVLGVLSFFRRLILLFLIFVYFFGIKGIMSRHCIIINTYRSRNIHHLRTWSIYFGSIVITLVVVFKVSWYSRKWMPRAPSPQFT